MMTVMLYGSLGKQFGKVHRYEVSSPAEAIRALCVTRNGFREALAECAGVKILRGGKEPVTLEEVQYPQSERESIRIVPAVSGAGRGLGGIILGAALIWASTFLPVAPLFSGAPGMLGTMSMSSIVGSMGMSLILGGVSQMLFSPPSAQAQGSVERPENRPSHYFDGAVNTAAQGNAVPICYGRLIVGSQVISAGLSVEQV